jgi:hypothetical protein
MTQKLSSPGKGISPLLRKGKGILSWFLGPTPAEDSRPGKEMILEAENPIAVPSTPVPKRAATPPKSCCNNMEEAPSLGHSGMYQILRNRILDVCFTRRSIQNEMVVLSRLYQSCTPPSPLLLYRWGSSKGSPPYALYWVRLARKQVEACDRSLEIRALKRPRWSKRLKIRSTRDLRNAIHWNGLDAERDTVLRFHTLASALNKAHRTLAWRIPHVVRTFERPSGGIRGVEGGPRIPLEEYEDKYLHPVANRLFSCAWLMQWVVEKDLAELNRISTQAGLPSVRLRTNQAGEGGASERFAWEDSRTGISFPTFRDRPILARDGTTALPSERVRLMATLDSRMEVVHAALTRMAEIAASGRKDLELFSSELASVDDIIRVTASISDPFGRLPAALRKLPLH